MRYLLLGIVSFGLLALAPPAPCGVTFVFNYTDAPGVGFNDSAEGAARKAALQQAANAFSNALSNWTATVEMDVDGSASGSTLAAAGSAPVSDFFTGGGFGRYEVIRNKILNGTDLNGTNADGSVVVNFSTVDWEFDPSPGEIDGAEFDWYSTMYHEFTHALGFSHGIVDQGPDSGEDGFGAGGFGSGSPGEWAKFDGFLSDSASNRIVSSTTFESTMSQAAWDALVVGGPSPAGGLFFDGPNAKAANGGQPVGLYTPTTYEPGSSIAHLDDENSALNGLMMLAAADPGPSARLFSTIELGILQDLGYADIAQIGPVIPEPSTLILASAGGLLILGFRRYRKEYSSANMSR